MSDYKLINLLEIEPSSRTPGLEGRFARKYLDSHDIGVSLFSYQPNVRNQSAHSHKVQEEAYVVASGSGRILLDGKVVELKKWDVLRVAPEVVRSFEAGPDGLELIAVGGPKPAEGDGVHGEADWPDTK
jgi:mannose-6-phosphate isomerase-like protein (cupin superfamily)